MANGTTRAFITAEALIQTFKERLERLDEITSDGSLTHSYDRAFRIVQDCHARVGEMLEVLRRYEGLDGAEPEVKPLAPQRALRHAQSASTTAAR